MIIGVDIETKGLDATKYITGSLHKDKHKKTEIYRDKKELWERIIQLGKKEAKRGKTLAIYSHNAKYDTAGYVNLKDKNMKYFSHRPFIWAYKQNKEQLKRQGIKTEKAYKEIIKFLDTKNIFGRMTLKQLGKLIGTPKKEYPVEQLEKKEHLTNKELKELEEYCKQDARICTEAIRYIDNKLKREGIKIKRIYTINQIARQYLWKKWLTLEDKYLEPYFWNKKTGEARRTFRAKEIHASYRGGRCEAWKTGITENVDYYDCKSAYADSITKIKTPNLKTERKHTYQEGNKQEFYNKHLKMIGIARVAMKNENNKIGLLQIRTEKDNYYPEPETIFIGTYTHTELQKAKEEGYKILDVEWSVTYKQAPNPFKKIMPEIYKKRQESKTEFDNWFYKMMMNAGIGKMAQHRTGQEIIVDSVEEAENYLRKNYKIIQGIDANLMYQSTTKKGEMKPYYMPIIVSLTTAHRRIEMYKEFKRIGLKNLIYTDTDSIIIPHNTKTKLKIGKELGQYKKESENQEITIWGRKTYAIGKEMKVAGINKIGITMEDFQKGQIESRKQITIKTAKRIEEVGKFTTERRNLRKQLKQLKERKERLKEQKLLIDYDINDITHFIPTINKELDT